MMISFRWQLALLMGLAVFDRAAHATRSDIGGAGSSHMVVGLDDIMPPLVKPMRQAKAAHHQDGPVDVGSLLESRVPGHCNRENTYRLGGMITDKGMQSFIYEVFSSSGEALALKVAKTSDDNNDIKSEANIMRHAGACGDCMMPLFTHRPCIYKNGQSEREAAPLSREAYVTLKMDSDLQKWIDDAKSPISTCRDAIRATLTSALERFHGRVRYMHGDLKPDNIFIRGNPGECPTDVRLADFGLSARLGTEMDTYEMMYLTGSRHLPTDMFGTRRTFRHSGNLNLKRGRALAVEPVIDWCSFYSMLRDNFHFKYTDWVPRDSKVGSSVDCGSMGSDRLTRYGGSLMIPSAQSRL